LASACGACADDDEFVASSEEALTPLVSKRALAFHWAPRHIQDVNKASMNGKADYISRVDYDGDFVTTNNWDNLGNFNTVSSAYFAVTESTTHWFIYYMFYHPRDWATSAAYEHENDAEGTLVFVRKDGTGFGKFEGMVTQAHGEFNPYRNPNVSLTKGSANRTVNTVTSVTTPPETFARPQTYQEPSGHGFLACGSHVTNCVRNDDGIVYVPTQGNGAVPPIPIPDGKQVPVSYSLIDLTEPGGLFSRRNDPALFSNGRSFRGDSSGGCGGGFTTFCSGSADAIWAWGPPEFGQDPATFVRNHFNFGALTPPSSNYVRNDFRCGHDLCQTGSPMVGGEFPCVPCAQQICDVDPFCCNGGWDDICVSEVPSVCGLSCN
jgi:hypothetical protein